MTVAAQYASAAARLQAITLQLYTTLPERYYEFVLQYGQFRKL